ncbi:MAG: DUF4446 family protein [Candidatus Vogelbacteria bacterium]|nr:DUF4446 family protein [Candidatus Vogelbacteria bacterium]
MENVVYFSLGLSALSLIWVMALQLRIKKLLRGKAGHDLEDLMRGSNADLEKLIKAREEIGREIEGIKEKMRHHIRGIKTVRFNPFRDSGSNQSFATALVDDNGNGVVISTLYSRDRVGVYAKPLESHKSEYDLSDEERQAIAQARNHR